MNNSLRLALSLSVAALALSLAPSAQAATSCKADAECGAGFYCEIAPAPSVGCASADGSPCEVDQPPPATEGYCREKPLSCTTDAECPSYLACTSSGGDTAVACTGACPPGADCPEPVECTPMPEPKDAPKICTAKLLACAADSECPTGFACNLAIGNECSAVACAPGEKCPEPNCAPSTKACGPKEIACKADSECPADWRCLTLEEGSCSGGGSTEPPPMPGGDIPTPAPAPGSAPQDDCTVTTRSLCVPKGYLAGIESSDVFGSPRGSEVAEAASDSNTKGSSNAQPPGYSAPTQGTTNGSSPSSNDDSGCSTSGRSTGSGLLGMLLVGLAARLARRRSA